MKKYLGIIIALLVGIGVFSIPSEVNAMTQKDLGGKVYLKQSNAPSQGNRRLVILFNKDATRCIQFNCKVDENNNITDITSGIKGFNKESYDKALNSKKDLSK